MPKFLIYETLPCWVTYVSTVEAKDSTEALEKFGNGEHTQLASPEIGDIIDGYDGNIEVEPYET